MESISSSLLDEVRSLNHKAKCFLEWEKAVDTIEDRIMLNNGENSNTDEINAMKALCIRKINYGHRSYMRPLYFGLLNVLEDISSDIS